MGYSKIISSFTHHTEQASIAGAPKFKYYPKFKKIVIPDLIRDPCFVVLSMDPTIKSRDDEKITKLKHLSALNHFRMMLSKPFCESG
jgi:hypothetical protein